jgi:hypothetical protein
MHPILLWIVQVSPRIAAASIPAISGMTPGNKSACMRGGREAQAGIRQRDHRHSATSHDRGQSSPSVAFERETLVNRTGQQERT